MAKIPVAGLKDVKPEALLTKGRYHLRAEEAKIITKDSGGTSLSVKSRVLSGIPQEDGGSPEDRILFDFFPLDGYDKMKDGGNFVKQKLAAFLNAAGVAVDEEGFDADEIVGSEFDAIVKQKADLDDVMQNNISKYLPTEA